MIHFIMVEILPALVWLLPLYLLLHKLYFHKLTDTAVSFLFCCYLCAVYALVGLPNITYVRFELSGNLIPLAGIRQALQNYALNIALFLPLGMFLPLLWKSFRPAGKTVLFGFCMSLTIELLQIFTYRATDVNDLITNTLGALLGWIVMTMMMRIIPSLRGLYQRQRNLAVIFGSAFGGMFFLQPFLVGLL